MSRPWPQPADRSLSVKLDPSAPSGFVVHSFADDDPIACRDYVRAKLGLPSFEPPKKKPNAAGTAKGRAPVVAEYVYRTADGKPYLLVKRTANKDFPQFHHEGSTWRPGKPTGPKIPYRLPELLAAPLTTPIYIVEGEKDVDNLAMLGFVGTCNSEGADTGSGKKWTPELNQHFTGRHVYIIPDNDAPGRKHAEHVARSLAPMAASVRIVELPGLGPGGDVSDWLAASGTANQLSALAAAGGATTEPAGDTAGDATADEAEPKAARTPPAKDVLLKLARAANLFHTSDWTAYADFVVNGHRETWPVRSKGFRRWLRHRYYRQAGGAPNADAMEAALGVIEAKAHYEGPEQPVAVRVAGLDSRFYIDLCSPSWQAIEIDERGWRIVDTPPVRFRRAPGMLPLPVPERGGHIDTLRPFLNLKAANDQDANHAKFVLTVSVLVSYMRQRTLSHCRGDGSPGGLQDQLHARPAPAGRSKRNERSSASA
jgi:hypothetical protein